jgi:hypothetical protein
MRNVTGGMINGMIMAAALAGVDAMGGYRPDTHAQTSTRSKEDDKQRAEEKRRRKQAKRQQ